MSFSTKPLPTIVLLGLFGYACPTPKAGDDRLAVDAESNDTGTSNPDGGSPDPDAATQDGSTSDGSETPDGSAPDGTTPDGTMRDGGDAGNPGCVPTGPEDCFNSLDDDCINGIDCNDPACGACVAAPMGFALGLIVDAASPCPAGFETQQTPIFAGLDQGPGCVGTCACSPNPTTCLGELYIYPTNAQCMNDVNLTGGQLYTGLIDATCTANPVADGFPGGYRLGNWTVMQSCAPSGVASPSPYSWMAQMKFCVPALGLQGRS